MARVPAFLVADKIEKFNKFNRVKIDNINLKNGFIFIHIPKNAGSSVNKALGIVGSHMTAREYHEMLGWPYRLFFTFCFVRNPWSRFLSLYNFARMDESYYHSAINPEKSKYGKHLDYDVLKDASLNECAHLLIEGKLKHDTGWNHWLPQTNWVCNERGKSMVDFIGRIENIDEDFHRICKKTGFKTSLLKINASHDAENYRPLYDNETRDIVANYYAADIKKFGYTF